MIRINLLPWREERRKHREQAFYRMLGGCVASTILVMALFHMSVRHSIGVQESRNRFLEAEITRLTEKAKEVEQLKTLQKRLEERFALVQGLEQERYGVVHIFEELIKSVPDGVFLSEAERKGEQLVLKGKAESNTRVSQFLRNLAGSAWFYPPVLMNVQTEDNHLLGFSLTVRRHEPKTK